MRLGALALLFAWINYSLYLKPDKSHAKEPDIQQLNDTNDKTTLPSEYQVEVTQKDGSVQYLALDDYLVGVVAGEMPLSFEDEALKAQTVASRTFAFSRGLKEDKTTNTQV